MKLAIYLILIFCISGCAFHSGMMTANPDYIKPEYELKTTVTTNAKSTRILGIGGLGKSALVAEAKNQLYQYYPLRNEEAYANISVDFRDFYFFIYHRTKATVTADVIGKVNASAGDTTYQSLFIQKQARAKPIGILKLGNQGYIMKNDIPMKYTILDIINEKKVLMGVPGHEVTFKVKNSNVFLPSNKGIPNVEFEAGETVLAYILFKWRRAIIIGLNERRAIVELEEKIQENKYYDLPYGNIKYPDKNSSEQEE